jgi:hypothetical protein
MKIKLTTQAGFRTCATLTITDFSQLSRGDKFRLLKFLFYQSVLLGGDLVGFSSISDRFVSRFKIL